MPIHLRLKELRLKAKLTQKELATRADVSQPAISRIERGDLTNVSLDFLERLANGLRVDARDLIEHRRPRG